METINGYSINDKARLEAEMANFKHKRNTSLAVGITLFAVAIVAIFVIVGIMMADTVQMAESAGSGASYTYEEIMSKYAGLMVLIYLLAFAATAGEIIAAAGGISNHIKFANRRKTLQRLKEIEPNVEQF